MGDFEFQRERMVALDLKPRGITDPGVLKAMEAVPMENYMLQLREYAYIDRPLPLAFEQTISQPYIVAYMTQALKLKKTDKVLEIGTGSGYQTAVLAEIAKEVYSVEIIKALFEHAQLALTLHGYINAHLKWGDGSKGWKEHAPYDAILLTAACPSVPQDLLSQLAVGGRLLAPVGENHEFQRLHRITRKKARYFHEALDGVRFVMMTGSVREE